MRIRQGINSGQHGSAERTEERTGRRYGNQTEFLVYGVVELEQWRLLGPGTGMGEATEGMHRTRMNRGRRREERESRAWELE
jgi:hypothetical protein